jgi:uncharacterized protein with ATP-grasp and redox domains
MKTYQECIPCFYKQAGEAAELAGADDDIKEIMINEISKVLPEISLSLSPPEIAQQIHYIVRAVIGKEDPYIEVKRRSNESALKLYPTLKKKVIASGDRLLTAVEIAAAGNVIDYGVKNNLDIRKEIDNILSHGFSFPHSQKKSVFEYEEFKKGLAAAGDILYLADNAGEIVFDKILLEELKGKETVFAVRGKPIINDALVEDALACGIDKVTRVISNGSDAPGTILKDCSSEFRDIYDNAGLIISKGQGNFETLSEEPRPIYFLFKVKCPVIAKDIGSEVGSIVLKKARRG